MLTLLRPAQEAIRKPQAISAQRTIPSSDAWLSVADQQRLLWTFVLLGIAARAVRFLLCFPLWEDECFLVSNFIDRGFHELLAPLNYHQVAPIGLLGIELALVKLLGFSEWSLRLFPFVCGVGGIALFARLTCRLMEGPARLIAVATFCASYSGIRYGAEAKPYGVDLFVALVMLTLAVEWWRGRRTAWLVALIATMPLAIATSYPAIFVAGGLSVFMALVLYFEHRPGWAAWSALNVVMFMAFLVMLRVAAKGQSEAELRWMQDYWKDHLPSLFAPWQLVSWFFVTHTGDLLAIPLGGERGASIVSFLLIAAGLVTLKRTRQYRLMALCLAPAAFNLLAAFMGRFPYGGHVKFSQYLAPAICLLIGIGGAAILSAGRDPFIVRRRKLAIALVALALIPLGTMARDFVLPYKSATDARYRDFARWFWPNLQFGGEAACLHSDLGLEFAPGTFHHLGWSAMYLCNQHIYSPRHRSGRPLDWNTISVNHPLHCVEYRAQVYPYNDEACQHWLDRMGKRYQLVSRDTFPSPVFDQRGKTLLCADSLVIYKFIPR